MRKLRPCFRTSALVIFTLVFATACSRADAETVTLKCDAPEEMMLVYDGDESGTLTVTEFLGCVQPSGQD